MYWYLYKSDDSKFPYTIFLEENPGQFLILRVQAKWPGPGKKIFCISEGFLTKEELPEEQPLETCPLILAKRWGKKLNIVLDRKTRRRCWFLFLKKEYKTMPGQYYEQIFWITQSSVKMRGPGAYIPQGGKQERMEIVIDKREHYPYKFVNSEIKKENLKVGDYALIKDGCIVAVAERKTLDNFLHELRNFEILKISLQELRGYPYKALFFDSPYSEFLNPKTNQFYSPTYTADIIAELFISYPDIQIVFFKNRKLANEWLYRWFKRIWVHSSEYE